MAVGAIAAAVIAAYAANEASRRSKSGMDEQAREARKVAELQKRIYEKGEQEAEPFRRAIYPQLLDILSSKGTDTTKLTSTPMYSLMRSPLEDQYSRAKEALGTTPGGGALTRALADLEVQRAESVGRIPGQLYTDVMNTGMGIAGTNLQQGPASLASAGQTYSGLMGQYTGMYNQSTAAMGQAGSAFGQALYDMYLKGGSSGASTPSTTGQYATNYFTKDTGTW